MVIQIVLTLIASEKNFVHLTSKWKKCILIFTNKWFFGMCGVQTCKRRSSHSTQDYHSIEFRLFLVTLGCGGSVTANYWLDLFCHQFLCSIIAYIQVKKSAHCVNFFLFAKSPQKLTQLALITTCCRNWFGLFMKCDLECDFHDCDKMPKHVEMIRTKCQPKIWDGQNANHR